MDLEEQIANLEVEILELKEQIKEKRKQLELLTQQYRSTKMARESGQKTLDDVNVKVEVEEVSE